MQGILRPALLTLMLLLVGSSFLIVGNNETVNNKTEFNQQTIRFTEHEQNYSWPMQTGEFLHHSVHHTLLHHSTLNEFHLSCLYYIVV